MILIKLLFILVQACIVIGGQLKKMSSKGLNPYSSNKGEKSYYSFQFLPDNSIENNGMIEIIFPLDFEALAFPNNLECRIQSSENAPFELADCIMQTTRVIHITVNEVPISLISIIVGEVANPRFIDTSSQFKIRTYRNDVLIDSNDAFGFISFSEKPGKILNPNVFKLSNSRIREGSSWEFQFTPSKTYPMGTSLRFTFPQGYTSKQALCDVHGLSGENPETLLLFNQRIIICQNINMVLKGQQSVKIINMVNPDFSGIMQGFKIEILEGSSSVILEQATFAGNIEILPGPLKASYVSDDQFKWSTTTYSFFINLINPVYLGDRLYFNFTSDWTMTQPNCTIINGFSAPFGQKVRCQRIPDQNAYMIDNFVQIDSTRRLVFSVLLESPHVENQYPVTISTFNTKRSAVVDFNSIMININSTYGIIQRFTAHALKSPQTSKAGENGALEMTFFLKTQLPKTDVGTEGHFRVDIFPQIPVPEEKKYGSLRCYFYGDVYSGNDCKTDYKVDKSERTYIHILTPNLRSFKESEVPISVTTNGPNPGYKAGIKLDELVQRYKIHVNIWKELNKDLFLTPDTPPDEVYFTEFIPESIKITDPSAITVTSTITNANAYTYFEVKYIHGDDYISIYKYRDASQRNYALRIHFMNGFASDLGWGSYLINPTDKTIREFPCYLEGDLINDSNPTNSGLGYSNCEIVFKDSQNTYIQVNNLPTLNFKSNKYITVGIPKIKINNFIGSKATISVRLIEETPRCMGQIVTLYQKEDIEIFTITSPYSTVGSGLTVTPVDGVRLNLDSKYKFDITQTGTSSWALIEWPSNLKLDFGSVTCTGGSCKKFNGPVYWVLFTPSSAQTGPTISFTMPLGTTKNYKNKEDLIFKAQSWVGNQITQIHQKIYSYVPVTMATTKFYCSDPTDYKFQGYQQKQQIEFTLEEPMDDNWYIELVLVQKMTFQQTDNFYFEQTNLVELDGQGVLTEIISPTKFWIYNLKKINKGVQIKLTISITMDVSAATFTPQVIVKTMHQYYRGSIDDKSVNIATINHQDGSITLSEQSMIKMTAMNPISYRYELIQNSIGPFNFKINFKGANIDPNNAAQDRVSLLFKFQLNDGTQDGFDIISAGEVFRCTITDDTNTSYFHECFATKDTTKKQLIIELFPYTLLNKLNYYSFEISSDQSLSLNSYYGIKFPTKGGYYNFEIWVRKLSLSNVKTDDLAYYEALFVRPPELKNISITLAHRTPLIKNIFTFDMTVKDAVPAYSSGGRIRIYFPGYQNGAQIFDTNLDHDPILYNAGCRFITGFTAESSEKLKCSLGRVNSDGEWNNPFVELMNFSAISANTQLVMQVGNVANPPSTIKMGNFRIHTYEWQPTAVNNNIINSMTETVVFDLSGSPAAITNAVNVLFEAGKKINSSQTYLDHKFQVNVNLNVDDLLITEIPLPLRLTVVSTNNKNNLLTCDTSIFKSCESFDEGNYIVWKLKNSISANTLIDARIDITGLPNYAETKDTTFYSYIVNASTQKVTHKITEQIKATEWAKIVDNISVTKIEFKANQLLGSCIWQRYVLDLTFTNDIPAGGSILITPTSGISSSDLVPKCLMQENTGYLTYNEFSKYGGMLGCSIQNNGWYFSPQVAITGGKKLRIETYSIYSSDPGTVQFKAQTFSNTSIDIVNTGQKLDQGLITVTSSPSTESCNYSNLSILTSSDLSVTNVIPFSNQETLWQIQFTLTDQIYKDDFVVLELVNHPSGSDFYPATVDTTYQWFYQPADFIIGSSSIGGACMFYVPSNKLFDNAQKLVCTNFNNDISPLTQLSIFFRIKNPNVGSNIQQNFYFYSYRRSSIYDRYNYYDSSSYSKIPISVSFTQPSPKPTAKTIKRSNGAVSALNVDLTIDMIDSSNLFSCNQSDYDAWPSRILTCQLTSGDIAVAFTTLYDEFTSTKINQPLKISTGSVVGTYNQLKGCGALYGIITTQVKNSESLKFDQVVNNPDLYYFSNELLCNMIYYKKPYSWLANLPTLSIVGAGYNSCTINPVSAGGTITATLHNGGLINNESRTVGKVNFKIQRNTPLYSKVYLTFSSAKTQLQFANKVSISGVSSPHSPLILVPVSATKYELIGLPQISATTDVNLYFGMKSNSVSSISMTLIIVHPNGRTTEFNKSFSFSQSGISSFLSTGYKELYKMKRYMKDSNQKAPLQFLFQLRSIDITSVDKLTLSIPAGFTISGLSGGGKQLSDYQNFPTPNDYYYWLHGTPTALSSSPIDITIGSLSTIQQFKNGNDYHLLLTTRYADTFDGFQYPANIGYYRFSLKGYKGATAKEFGYDLLAIEAEGDQKLTVTALNTNIGHETVINFKWQITVAAASGDEIWLEFQTNNGRPPLGYNYDLGFDNLLGYTNIHQKFECIEATNSLITTTNVLTCELFRKGDKSQNPAATQEVQAAIRIPITKAIAANTNIEFYLSGIKNPIYADRDVRITISLRKSIAGFNDSPKLAYQKSIGFYRTTNGFIPILISPNSPTIGFPAQSTTFSATNTVHSGGFYTPFAQETHTWNIISTQNVNNNDWIKVIYTLDNNPNMGTTCKPITDTAPKCVFPVSGFVVAQYKGTSAKSVTLNVSGMQNGIYRYAGKFTVEHWNGSDGSTVTAFNVAGLVYEWDEDPAFKLGFQPYSTPVEDQYRNTYWLTDFMNVIQVNITGIWKYNNIKSFWLDVPPEITYTDMEFCNSTQVTPVASMNPYPWRFNCRVVNKHRVVFEVTDDFQTWVEANNRNALIYLTFKFWINEFVKDGPTSDFVLQTYHMPYYQYEQNAATVIIDDYGVTRTRGNINISPYIQPDLRVVTFNSLRFYERKAKVTENVEIYMLLQPKTALSLHRVENIIFRIPEEFKYAPIRYFDACDVNGKFNTPVLSCELMRVHGQTFVNMTFYPSDPTSPYYKPGKDPYDNTVKIVRISAKSNSDLFTTPELPGEIYNITASLYSRDLVIEKQTINVTKIIGYNLREDDGFKNLLTQFQPPRDSVQLGLFQMRLYLDNYGVIAGYDTFAAKMYSQIVFIFDNVPFAYPFDIGTGLKNHEEVGCVGTGLTYLKTKKLTCILTYGFNAENLPYITVSGYDPIPANTDVRIYITQLQTVPQENPLKLNPVNQVPIRGGISYVYKDIGVSAFYYEPFEFLPVQNSPLAAVAGDQTKAVVSTGGSNNKVLEKEDYTFSFLTAATIKQTDYIALQFPDDYFERFSDYSGVNTSGFITKVFGISNMIYLSPLNDITAGSTITAQIKGLINPAYSQNIPIIIQGITMIDYKVKETFDFKLNGREIIPFDKFIRVEAISSTRVGGANGISYKVIFVTGHKVPSNGAFSVTMPPQYKFSLYEMKAQCSLIGFDPAVSCMVGSQNRMDVFLNGSTIIIDKEYAIILENVNSPNEDVSAFKIALTSYFSDNIYINQMICRQYVAFPAMIIQNKRACDLVIETTILNAKALSLYTFMLQCDDTVRPDTDLEIVLHEDYKIMNGLNKEIKCASNEPQTLRAAKCSLQLNNNFQYVLKIAINSIPSQSLFSIKVELINPKQINKPYTYEANLSSYSILYAQATLTNLAFSRAITFSPESSALSTQMNPSIKRQVSVSNIPRNAGQAATYILTVPPLGQSQQGNSPTEVRITFPSEDFSLTLGENISCGLYITQIDDKSFKTYKGILQLVQNSNTDITRKYQSLNCRVVQPYELIIDTSKLTADLTDIDESWQHWIIKNVYNPKRYNQQTKFHIQYINTKQILWDFEDNILYFISAAPNFVKVNDLKTEPSDIRTPSKYTFNLTTESAIPQNPIVGISVQLPANLYDTIEYLESSPLKECILSPIDSSIKSPQQQKLSCSIFNQEILIEQANFQTLLGQQTNSIQIQINKIFNPNLIYQCNSKVPDLNQYTFRFFDWNSGDIFLVSSPSIDTQNCISFVKNSFDINFEGPLTVQPGLSYAYKLKLEQPAHGLIITPNSPIGGIKFEPQIITLNNYENSDISLLVKIRSDVLPRTYLINFDVKEASVSSTTSTPSSDSSNPSLPSKLSDRSSFYLPISPLRLNVQEISNMTPPTVSVGDITSISIGYPIRVPVTLSKSPSNILMLIISIKQDEFKNIIIVNPPILQINPGETQTYFEISINTSKVPGYAATIEFALTSYYTIIHQLTQSTKYLSFSSNHDINDDYQPLQISLSKNKISTPSNEINQSVLNKDSKMVSSHSSLTVAEVLQNLSPKQILTKTDQINANNATLSIYASASAHLYIVLTYQGERPPAQRNTIINKEYKQGIQFQEFSVNTYYRISGSIDHLSTFTLFNLEAQTNYVIHMVMQNAYGYSSIFSHSFKTNRLSFGSIISIPVREIIPSSDIIKSLSLALRIPEDRFISQTNVTHFYEQSEKFDKDIMIKREYYYDIVITPDSQNDLIPTSDLVNKLQNDPLTRSLMKSLLPSFDLNNIIRQTQIIQGIPTIAQEIVPILINYNNATFSIRLWEQGYVFAIVQESSQGSQNPLSKQIFNGKNQFNQEIQQYQRFSQLSDKDGYAIITVDDLIDNQEYILYVTVGNHLPYSLLNLFEDDQIRAYKFKTPINVNLGLYSERFEQLQQSNPDLAQALIDFES